MTREEAITLFEKQLTAARVVLDSGFGSNPGEHDILYRRRKEMAEIALSALTPPTQEQMERVWPGCTECERKTCVACRNFGWHPRACTTCDAQNDWIPWEYCPCCGRPLTPEAWEELRKRLEVLYENIE